MNDNNRYYVYGLFEGDVCFYIGKGTGKRKDDHFRCFKRNKCSVNPLLYSKLLKLKKLKITPTSKILIENLSENEALENEKELIIKYGKKINGGTLCNLLDGGTQPPTYQDLLKFKSVDEIVQIKQKQVKSTKKTIHNKNFNKINYFKKMANKNILLKDIAKKLNVCTDTLRRWSKKYNIKINYNAKTLFIKKHLEVQRKIVKNKIQKTAKTYTIKQPDGSIIVVRKLVQYCKTHNIDYANLRKTYKGVAKHHKQYTIISQT